MADPTPQLAALPRKPPAVADGYVQSVPLSLVVSDHDSVAELIQRVEGRERDEYALTALRIGLLALKHARGQIDADAVRREGEKLLIDLKHALEQSRNQIHGDLTAALTDYFDPKSGRFQERVDRLIRKDGELEQLLQRQIGTDGSELAATLTAYIGDNSALMRLLNPEESKGLVASMRSAIADVVSDEKNRILKEFSLDNPEGALRRLVQELTDESGKLQRGLAEEVENVVSEFSLDKEDSALSRLVRRVEVAEQTITKEFSLDEQGSALSRLSAVISSAKDAVDQNLTLDTEQSALSRLKREIVTILQNHEKKVEMFQTNVQVALAAMTAQRAEADRSTQHGKDFEDVVAEFIEKEMRKSGDIPTRTGTTVGSIRNCKKGDVAVELGADCVAAGQRFVVEAKEDASFTLAKARDEIEIAKKNRDACVGLFVFSVKTAPDGIESLLRQGDNVFVVWDADRIETDVVLRAALFVAKAICIQQEKRQNAENGNWDNVDAAILTLEKEANRLANMKTWTETIQSNSGKVLDEVRKMADALERQITSIRESVAALRQE